jgi:hypothetical protein
MKKKPRYISNLENAYGFPSQKAFGSAVFYENLRVIQIQKAALEKYRYFVGDLWDRYGEKAWMGGWKEVYSRKQNVKGDIINELRNITNLNVRGSVPMFLDGIENPQKAQAALEAAFNDPAVSELTVHNIGDNGAMSGLLITAFRKKTSDATFVIFLMD